MTDIVQKYKKKKLIDTASIVVTSLLLAVGLNSLLTTSDLGKSIKTSVKEASNIQESSLRDIYVDKVKNTTNNLVNINISKDMTQVRNLSFSLIFDSNNIDIKDITPMIDSMEISKLSNNNGFLTISLNFKNTTNLKSGETLFTMLVNKKENKIENINILNANFADTSDNVYYLTTSGIDL